MSVKAISYPNGAFGQESQWYQPAELLAAGNITVASGKPVVVINANAAVTESTTTSEPTLAVGIAVNPAVSGQAAMVAVGGIVTGVRAQGAITAGATVGISASVAGAVAANSDPGEVIGVAIAAADDNLVDLYVYKA